MTNVTRLFLKHVQLQLRDLHLQPDNKTKQNPNISQVCLYVLIILESTFLCF